MKEEFRPRGCGDCSYCQIRYVKKYMDNTFKCKAMQYKTIDVLGVWNNTPDWCPLPKKEEAEARLKELY